MNVTDLAENDAVVLTTRDGFNMNAIFIKWQPSALRYEFIVDLAQGCSTTVLFDTKTLQSHTITRIDKND